MLMSLLYGLKKKQVDLKRNVKLGPPHTSLERIEQIIQERKRGYMDTQKGHL